MELYIIRHGETVWNALGKLQGRNDIELNEKGREAAGRLGQKLEKISFDKIYSSPLIRAYETACLIRGHRNIPIIRDEHLLEMNFGIAEGTVWTNWKNTEFHTFFDDTANFIPPEGGESFEQVSSRTKEFLQKVIEPQWQTARRIMIVAHGALNAGIIKNIRQLDLAHYWGDGLQKNCQAAVFNFDGEKWISVAN